MQKNENTEEKENKKKEDKFNIIVTYAKNGQSFQSIAENIIIRRLNEIFSQL